MQQSTRSIYLDYAAATPMSEAAIDAMQPYLREKFYNPSSPYAPAVAVRRELEEFRHRAAQAIGVQAADCIFTAGATESINLALTAIGDGHGVTLTIEHDSVLAAIKHYDHTIVDVHPDGTVDLEALHRAITAETRVVSVGLVNNEIGVIQPLAKVREVIDAEIARRREAGNACPLWLHTDASQAVGLLDTHASRLGVDMMTINAAKLYGPKQMALLWRRSGIALSPIVAGGEQEMGLRSGTESVGVIAAFVVALERAVAKRDAHVAHLTAVRQRFIEKLTTALPMMQQTTTARTAASIIHVSFPGLDAERLVFRLEARGVYVATGSACAAARHQRSHVLEAINCSDKEIAGSLRVSFGAPTTLEDAELATQIISEEVSAEYARISKQNA